MMRGPFGLGHSLVGGFAETTLVQAEAVRLHMLITKVGLCVIN